MKPIGHHSELTFKLFMLCIYGEGDLDYVRRKGLKFIVTSRPLTHRFNKTTEQMIRAFRALEKMGYIHSFDIQAAEYHFVAIIPNYLQLIPQVTPDGK